MTKTRNGKGGKKQKQYILPEDVKFVEKYFAGVKPDEKIFSESELENKLPYHTIRANHAKQMYDYYLEKLNGDNGDKYREELKKKHKKPSSQKGKRRDYKKN